MYTRKRSALDVGLLIVLILLGYSAIELLILTSLLWRGVAGPTTCAMR